MFNATHMWSHLVNVLPPPPLPLLQCFLIHATTTFSADDANDGPTGGAVGYTRHGPPPGATGNAHSKRRRVEPDLSVVRGQVSS